MCLDDVFELFGVAPAHAGHKGNLFLMSGAEYNPVALLAALARDA